MMADTETRAYVGALWHHNCDPFCRVIATTREKAKEALDAAANGVVPCGTCDEIVDGDDIHIGGIFEENLSTLEDITPEQMADLFEYGLAYLDT